MKGRPYSNGNMLVQRQQQQQLDFCYLKEIQLVKVTIYDHHVFHIYIYIFFPQYDIVGHSGESPEISFVTDDTLPKNNRERLDIMKEMHAHAQYCMSGDFTLEATSRAINTVSSFDADEHLVVVLSDANLERYGIPASQFGKVLTGDPKVNAFAVFIGSLGNQADR